MEDVWRNGGHSLTGGGSPLSSAGVCESTDEGTVMSVGLRGALVIRAAVFSVLGVSDAGRGQSEEQGTSRGGVHVYLFRGFTGMFSQGMDEIGGKLRRRGIPATVHAHFAWSAQAAAAIDDYKRGRVRTVVLIGHSM